MPTSECVFSLYSLRFSPVAAMHLALGQTVSDPLTVITGFVGNMNASGVQTNVNEKVLWECEQISHIPNGSIGVISAGKYGTEGSIVRMGEGVVFDKQVEDADMLDHFFCIRLTPNHLRGVIVVEKLGTRGVANDFEVRLRRYWSQHARNCTLGLERMAPSGYLAHVLGSGQVKTIKFRTSLPNGELAAALEGNGVVESLGKVELKYKAKRNQDFSNIVAQILGPNHTGDLSAGLVEFVGGMFTPEETSLEVTVGKRIRTLRVDDMAFAKPDIVEELTVQPTGRPSIDDFRAFAIDLTEDILGAM